MVVKAWVSVGRMRGSGGGGGSDIGGKAKWLGKYANSAHACPVLMLEGMYKLPNNAKNTSTYRKSSPIEIGQIRRSFGGGGG